MIIFIFFIFFWLGISFRYSLVVFAIVAIILFIITFRKYKRKIGFICVGICILGVGLSYLKFDFKKQIYSGVVIDSKENYFLLLSSGEKLYTYNKNNEYEIGDYLKITGEKQELDFTVLESQFDFKDYLNKKGVYYSLKVSNIETKFSNPIRIRQRREKFLSHFSTEQRSLISSIMFSESNESEDIIVGQKLHLNRLFCVSGVYLLSFLKLIEFILSYFIKDKRWGFLPILILSPYLIFTFPRFTVIRVICLAILKYINKAFFDGKIRHLTLVGLLGIMFLLIDYHLGYQISFILGFTLPAMIMFIRDAFFDYKKIKGKIIQIAAIYLLLIPFELKFYSGVNPLSMVVQILLTPLFTLVAICSLFNFYGVPFYGITQFFTKGLSNLLGWLGKIAFQINGPPFNEWFILIYVLLTLVFYYYRSIKFIPIYRAIGVSLLSGITLYFAPMNNIITTQVSFINVGQGDACLIRKGATTILIDTGGLSYTDIARETLIPYLEKQRIYNVDLVITTHNDFDHSGAYDSLKENFYVKRKVTEPESFPINIGGITLENYNNHIAEYTDENDKSLVVGFTLSKKKYLIMGDAPKMVEQNIIKEYPNLDCDILKVGHHGSNTSTSDEFIKLVTPSEAIISCGKNNKYGHPHKETLNILKNNKVKILRTDELGTITYSNYIFM